MTAETAGWREQQRRQAEGTGRDGRLEGPVETAGWREQRLDTGSEALDPLCSQWPGDHELKTGWTWVEAMGMEDLEEGAGGGRLPGKPQNSGWLVGFIRVMCCEDSGGNIPKAGGGALSKGYTLCQLAVLIYFSNVYVYDCFVCMNVYASNVCLVSKEPRRGHQILWNQCYR